MAITIPVGGGSFVAVEGETYILSADTTGDITFTGDASFNVIIDTDQTAGPNSITFGAGTDPTVTVSPGVSAADTDFDANGDTLTVNVDTGASTGQIDAIDLNAPAGVTVNAGDDVTFNGNILGPENNGVDATYTFGAGATVNGHLTGTISGDTTMVIGDNLTVTGDFGTNSAYAGTAAYDVTLGNNTAISGSATFIGTDPLIFNAGDGLVIGTNFDGSGGADTVIFGDDWAVNGRIGGGQGDDQFYLGSTSTTDFSVIAGDGGSDGMTIVAPVGQETAFVAEAVSSGWLDNGDGTVSSQSGAGVFTFNNQSYSSWEAAATIPCFTAGTQIEVAHGETVNVEDLVQGDMVMTADHGLQPVRWIGTKTIGAAGLAAQENLRPIRIAAGALGDDMPKRDLLVSPQHRMLVRSKIARRMFDKDEVLVAAKHLVALDGIDVADDLPEVTYVHFLCDMHEIVFANGAPSESLYTGPQTLKSVSPEAVSEIMAIFPELADIDYRPLSSRQLANGHKGRELATRHMKNCRPLVAGRDDIVQSNLQSLGTESKTRV